MLQGVLQGVLQVVLQGVLQVVLQGALSCVLQCVLQGMDNVDRYTFSDISALYGVASISRLLKIIGLFCKRAL